MVKASNQPQKGRVLINETVAGLALDWLGAHHPAPAIVDLDAGLLAASPNAKFSDGVPLAAGLSFGSEYIASEPHGTIPADQLTNMRDIAGALACDTWIKNNDGRQYRVHPDDGDPKKYRFLPVDQGHSIAHDWNVDGLKAQTDPQQVTLGTEILAVPAAEMRPFIDRLKTFDAATADHIIGQVPPQWFNNDAEKAAMKDYLVHRAARAAEVLDGKYAAAAA